MNEEAFHNLFEIYLVFVGSLETPMQKNRGGGEVGNRKKRFYSEE